MKAVFIAFFLVSSANGHDLWINHGNYQSPIDGAHCCGVNDCSPIPFSNVKVNTNGYWITTLQEQVPWIEVQKSEDGQYWRCEKSDKTRRCFFAPPGSV